LLVTCNVPGVLAGCLFGKHHSARYPCLLKEAALVPRCRSDQRVLPSHAFAAAILRTLQAACHVVEQLAPVIQKASLQLIAQLAHSFFMPLCLTSLAALARMRVSALVCDFQELVTTPDIAATSNVACLCQT
jgi:hypothetical protein